MSITVTKLYPSGAYECSAIVGDYLVRRVYYGYTKRQARAMFRQEVQS